MQRGRGGGCLCCSVVPTCHAMPSKTLNPTPTCACTRLPRRMPSGGPKLRRVRHWLRTAARLRAERLRMRRNDDRPSDRLRTCRWGRGHMSRCGGGAEGAPDGGVGLWGGEQIRRYGW